MRSSRKQRIIAAVLSIFLVTGGYAPGALAGMIGIQDLNGGSQTVNNVRQAVTQRLVELGVAPDLAQQRTAALSQSELRLLDQKLDELPAGAGAIEIIGIVFLVLLILELVGITNIFTKV